MDDNEMNLADAAALAAPAPAAESPRQRRVMKRSYHRSRKPRVEPREEREEVRETPREEVRTQGQRLQRTRKRTDDKFFIDQRIIPAGMDYNWKRESVYGKPDTFHMNEMMENHWTPVPVSRHPGLIVKQDGMVLMERPLYLSEEARREDKMKAQEQVTGVRQSLTGTPDGTFTREHPSVRANTRLNREYVPMTVAES